MKISYHKVSMVSYKIKDLINALGRPMPFNIGDLADSKFPVRKN